MNLAAKVRKDPRAPSTCPPVWETFSRVHTLHKWKGPPDCDGDVVEPSGRKKMDLSERRFPEECHRPENKVLSCPRHTTGPACPGILLVVTKDQGGSQGSTVG